MSRTFPRAFNRNPSNRVSRTTGPSNWTAIDKASLANWGRRFQPRAKLTANRTFRQEKTTLSLLDGAFLPALYKTLRRSLQARSILLSLVYKVRNLAHHYSARLSAASKVRDSQEAAELVTTQKIALTIRFRSQSRDW